MFGKMKDNKHQMGWFGRITVEYNDKYACYDMAADKFATGFMEENEYLSWINKTYYQKRDDKMGLTVFIEDNIEQPSMSKKAKEMLRKQLKKMRE